MPLRSWLRLTVLRSRPTAWPPSHQPRLDASRDPKVHASEDARMDMGIWIEFLVPYKREQS